jgi:hypothetical protein
MTTEEEKPLTASLLSLFGGILMLINGLLAGINKGPIILSTSPVSSPQEITSSTSPSWARVSFGFRGWAEGLWIPMTLMFASIVLYCSIMLYIRPTQRKTLCLLILLLSILGIPFGGGFIIGSILGVIGGAIGFEWPNPPGKTFFGKLLRALRLDPTLYRDIRQDPHALKYAAYAIIFVNILSGLGGGLYSFSVDKIVNAQSLDIPFKTLLLGEPLLDISILAPAIINIGMAVLKWITLSLLVYIVGILVIGQKATFEKIAAAVAFAYVPISLQLFMPFVLTSNPLLTFTWPFAVFVLTNAWVTLSLILAIRQVSEIPLWKSVGITSLTGAFYLLANQEFFMKLDIPYSIRFFLQPEPVFLTAVACLVIVATALGTFTRH